MRPLRGLVPLLPLALMVASAAHAAPAPGARALIDRVVAAHGGWSRLDRVHAYRVEGKLFAVRRHDESPTVRVFERPDRLKIFIGYGHGHEARLYDGEHGWRAVGGEGFQPAEGPMLESMALQAARAAVPWILREHLADARLTEPLDHHGQRLVGVEFPLPGGLVFRAYVDPATHRVRMSQGLLSHGGMQTHFETYYEDWRSVEGILFAFKEENWASGTHTGTTTLTKVELDPRLAPDEFVPPAEALAKPGPEHRD